jgi:hypothetical protein
MFVSADPLGSKLTFFKLEYLLKTALQSVLERGLQSWVGPQFDPCLSHQQYILRPLHILDPAWTWRTPYLIDNGHDLTALEIEQESLMLRSPSKVSDSSSMADSKFSVFILGLR